MVVRQVQGEAPHRQQSWHNDVDGAEADQPLRIYENLYDLVEPWQVVGSKNLRRYGRIDMPEAYLDTI